MRATSVRNGYIDVIKFIFTLIIIEFHLRTGIFEGGRIAVEGFFMINGYLMMANIYKNKFPNDSLGISTSRFIWNKYKALLPYMVPALLLSYAISCYSIERSLKDSARIFGLTIFDMIPLNLAGFDGNYPIGISWYLSGMFIALAFLYPLCKKYKSTFSLCVCPLLSVTLYGILSHNFGNLAVTTSYIEGDLLCAGIYRSVAGCALGCFMYEFCKRFENKEVKNGWRIIFTAIELFAFVYMLYVMHYRPMSKYDYVAAFAIFIFLLIGIGGLSYSSLVFRGNWTKGLNTLGLLLVLNHARLAICLRLILGDDYIHTAKIWIFFGLLAIYCLIGWITAKGIQAFMRKIKVSSIWK